MTEIEQPHRYSMYQMEKACLSLKDEWTTKEVCSAEELESHSTNVSPVGSSAKASLVPIPD